MSEPETEGLYFTYDSSLIARQSITANDHSNMVLFELGMKCSNESATTNIVDDFDACMDLCSFSPGCNYASFNDLSTEKPCVMTNTCSLSADKENVIYIKSSELQKIISRGSMEIENTDDSEDTNNNTFYISILLALFFILFYFFLF